MRRLVLGDVHGAYKALIQVFEKSEFNYNSDMLICLGDVADGWPDVVECFDELLKIKNLIYIIGNHDFWLYEWLKFGASPMIWTEQGGKATIASYINRTKKDGLETQKKHLKLLEYAPSYYITEDNILFVHGGLDWHKPIEDNEPYDLMWDRKAYQTAWMWEFYRRTHPTDEQNYFRDYKEVYVGHTTTNYSFGKQEATDKPLNLMNLWNLDQGVGYKGKLSLMDIDTKEYWQSDYSLDLYPNNRGR